MEVIWEFVDYGLQTVNNDVQVLLRDSKLALVSIQGLSSPGIKLIMLENEEL